MLVEEEWSENTTQGHNLEHQLEVVATRLRKYDLPSWSQLGRLYQRGTVPSLSKSTGERHQLTAGRSVIDSRSLATELLRVTSNDLTTILAEVPHAKPLKAFSAQEIAAPF